MLKTVHDDIDVIEPPMKRVLTQDIRQTIEGRILTLPNLKFLKDYYYSHYFNDGIVDYMLEYLYSIKHMLYRTGCNIRKDEGKVNIYCP